MSLSASDNSGSYRVTSGKTPPPAPSAAFARRARETQADERLGPTGGRYRPPALRGLSGSDMPSDMDPQLSSDIQESVPPTSNYPPGFRRARAGTLPSNVQLAAQRFAQASNSLASTPGSTESFQEQLLQARPSLGGGTPTRPNLRHSTSVASSNAMSAATERNSRLRSGSLTLPAAGLSSAFGSSLFSSSWLPSSAAGGGFPVLDELRSVTSADSGTDEFNVHTLDYLGLDDSQRQPQAPAATISELRSQAQAAILANPSSRHRANTVSNPYRMRTSNTSSLLGTPVAAEEEEYFDEFDDHTNTYTRSRMNSLEQGTGESAYSGYAPRGYRPSDPLASSNLGARPRAISMGTLDDPLRPMSRRPIAPEVPTLYSNENTSQIISGINQGGIMKTSDRIGGSRASPSVHFPNGDQGNRTPAYLQAPGPAPRAVSPKSEQQVQTPTRSLWIGNLDSAVTSEQLIHVFAPYGAIESLRLLPEKECGFVNFVDQADAIRAKEDVLNRLGGNIGMPNGQTVRIGFGKADSAPAGPAKGTTAPSNAAPSPGMTSKSPGIPAGMDAQLQSSPTRALWIGSIPSTTTPATILSVFSPYGPIESARVLTHKNCGFINFERLDDAVRARKALNGRDVLGSDVGAIRIGFAKVPVKGAPEGTSGQEESPSVSVTGIGDLSVGATIHALRSVKGASTIPADQQVLGGLVENYRSNLVLNMIASGAHTEVSEATAKPGGPAASVTEQQMVYKALSVGVSDTETDIQALADFRPPTMYYTTIPLVSDRQHNKRWDAAKLRELRKRLDSGLMSIEEVDQIASEFLDGEIVDLASDWLGNTVVQKLFERCTAAPRFAMLERIVPNLAMIGIHKNGTWAAQKIIECVQSPEEIALIAQNLRPYAPPLLLDQFGNYVIQCCLRFGYPANDFIFDAMVDRMWEVAQGRFGARSMRACLESPHVTISQQRRIATAIILNSIPLATNPNGALLLTWLLDNSGFPSRYNLLAPRFTPHLSHLCTHKLASLTVLRIVNQRIEPDASQQLVDGLFNSPGDHVLTDVLGDQVNGVAVVHKILTSPYIDAAPREEYMEATKRVLIELKVIATQAYRRLIEEVGLPVPSFQPTYTAAGAPPPGKKITPSSQYSMPGLPSGYPSSDQGLASMMASLQMGGQNPQAGPPQLHIDPQFSPGQSPMRPRVSNPSPAFSPSNDPYSGFATRSPDAANLRGSVRRVGGPMPPGQGLGPSAQQGHQYVSQAPGMPHNGNMMMNQPEYNGLPPQQVPPQMYQAYMYSPYQQNSPGMGGYPS